MARSLLGILRHQFLEVGLGALMLLKRWPGPAIGGCKFRPAVGCAHVDDPDRFQPRPRWLYPEQMGRVPAHDAAPERLLGGEQEVLVQRISMDGQFVLAAV